MGPHTLSGGNFGVTAVSIAYLYSRIDGSTAGIKNAQKCAVTFPESRLRDTEQEGAPGTPGSLGLIPDAGLRIYPESRYRRPGDCNGLNLGGVGKENGPSLQNNHLQQDQKIVLTCVFVQGKMFSVKLIQSTCGLY